MKTNKKVVFKLVATCEINAVKWRTETVYTYVSADGQYGIQFHSHPTRAFDYVVLRTHNLTLNGKQHLQHNVNAITEAFVTRGLDQYELGGWDKAISRLTVVLR